MCLIYELQIIIVLFHFKLLIDSITPVSVFKFKALGDLSKNEFLDFCIQLKQLPP